MEHSYRTNAEYVIAGVYGLHQRELARIMGISQGAINRWVSGDNEAGEALADVTGVSLDFLRGRSPKSEMWSYDMRETRRLLREHLASIDTRTKTRSQRFKFVASWWIDQKHDFCVEAMLAAYLRLNVETLRSYLEGNVSVEHPTILRLSDYVDVPAVWFEDGAKRHIEAPRFDAIIRRMRETGIDEASVLRMIDAFAMSRPGSM